MTLLELSQKYHTDKHVHSYIPVYEALFVALPIKVTKLFEIGIGHPDQMLHFAGPEYRRGASLRMWAEYFPDAEVWGMDIREDCLFEAGHIHTLVGDQSKSDDLMQAVTKIGSPIEVIIDDGSHMLLHQMYTARNLIHHVSQGGVYVIEDCFHPEKIVSELRMGEALKLAKGADDNMVVIRKGW